MWRGLAGLLATIAFAGLAPSSLAASTATSIPVVACKVQSGGGPVPRPPRSAAAQVPAPIAQTLSFYAVGTLLILAPRGWRCTGGIGANGSTSVSAYNRPIALNERTVRFSRAACLAQPSRF